MKERAILIDIVYPQTSKLESELRFSELESLVKTYGGLAVVKAMQKRSSPHYATFVGSGKIQEILDEMESFDDFDVIIINNLLKPRQIYNIEEICTEYQIQKHKEDREKNPEQKSRWENPKKIKVWDRIDLILKIFDKHAKTIEAKLQIELASIKHMGPRIFGMGLELTRQAGGIGTLGIGETNIEIMRRHLQRRTKTLEEKLKFYSKVQKRHRDQRRSKNLKTVSVVGYTNAGKSTLTNALTKKELYIADELFATLDSRAGELYLPKSNELPDDDPKKYENYKYEEAQKIIISDTIGFIQDLPPELIEAFKSTLAEIVEADLLLHVIDISDPNIDKKIQVVEEIIGILGCSEKEKIYVFNKIDELDKQVLEGQITEEEKLDRVSDYSESYSEYSPIICSALDKASLDTLISTVHERVLNLSKS